MTKVERRSRIRTAECARRISRRRLLRIGGAGQNGAGTSGTWEGIEAQERQMTDSALRSHLEAVRNNLASSVSSEARLYANARAADRVAGDAERYPK